MSAPADWGPRQRLKNALIRGAVVALLAVADRLPPRLLFAACRSVGRLLPWLAPGLARSARERARRSLPEAEAQRVARECFVNAGTSLAVTLLLRRPGARASSWVVIDDDARRELRRAGGAVVVSAPLGPFELVAPAVAELGLSPAVVVRESYDPALDSHVDAHRVAHGVAVIHRGRPGAAIRIVRALRSGQLVGVLPDLPTRVPSVSVEFLKQPHAMPAGPARLARAAGVPVLVCALEPLPGGRAFRLDVRRLADGDDCATRMTQRVADALSVAILRAPGWWLWMTAARAG